MVCLQSWFNPYGIFHIEISQIEANQLDSLMQLKENTRHSYRTPKCTDSMEILEIIKVTNPVDWLKKFRNLRFNLSLSQENSTSGNNRKNSKYQDFDFFPEVIYFIFILLICNVSFRRNHQVRRKSKPSIR